jgi:hypothetical protein
MHRANSLHSLRYYRRINRWEEFSFKNNIAVTRYVNYSTYPSQILTSNVTYIYDILNYLKFWKNL